MCEAEERRLLEVLGSRATARGHEVIDELRPRLSQIRKNGQ